MTYKEALKHIGRNVRAWTAANGVYTGQLVEVIKQQKRPWKGQVLINGVIKPASFEHSRPDRKGFRRGTVIEVSGVSIKPSEAVGGTYLEALERELREVDSCIEEERRIQETYPQEEASG